MLKHPRLQLSSVVLLLTMLAFLGPGRALAQEAAVGIVQQAVTRAGLNGVQAPAAQTLVASAEAGSATETHLTASIAWTTFIALDVLLLSAALVFGFAAIVLTIWPLTYGHTNLLSVSDAGPKPHNADRPMASGAGTA